MIQNKVFLVKQREDKFVLHDKVNDSREYIHFDKFKGILIRDFSSDVIEKALEWLASSKEILLDLENKKIALIKDKQFNFDSVIKQMCSLKEVKRSLDAQMIESLE
jgi:hypothetical protein